MKPYEQPFYSIEESLATVGQASEGMPMAGGCIDLNMGGAYSGQVLVERSYDGGTSWTPVASLSGSTSVSLNGINGPLYRVRYLSGTGVAEVFMAVNG